MPLFLLLVCGLPASARALLIPERGGPAPLMAAQRALLIQGAKRSHVLAQVGILGETPGFCWVLPVPGRILEAKAVLAEAFEQLDHETAPHRVDMPPSEAFFKGCSMDDAPLERDAPRVGGGLSTWEQQPGVVRLGTFSETSALAGWLEQNGCMASGTAIRVLEGCEERGWQFAAAHMPPLEGEPRGEGLRPADYMEPTRAHDQALWVSFESSELAYALESLDGSVQAELDLLIYLVGLHRFVPVERPLVELGPPGAFAAEAFDSVYDHLLRTRLEEGGPGAFATEYAAPLWAAPGAASMLRQLMPGEWSADALYLTRLRSILAPADLGGPLRFEFSDADRAVRIRIISSAGPIMSMMGGGHWLATALVGLLLLAGRHRSQKRGGSGGPREKRGPTGPASLLAVMALASAALSSSSCLPIGSFRSARLTPPKSLEASLAFVPARDPRHDLDREDPVPQTSTPPRAMVPGLGLSYGLGSGHDLGLLVYPLGARLDLRRSLVTEETGPLSLVAGIGLAGFWDPTGEERCIEAKGSEVEDGCFEETRWGGLVEVPLTVSQRVGSVTWYTGAKVAVVWLGSDLCYRDRHRVFSDINLDKESLLVTAGVFFGAELLLGANLKLVPELQVMSSVNEVDRLVYYVMPGVALRYVL